MFFADSHIHMTDDDPKKSLKMLDDMAALGVTHTTIQSLPYRGIHYNLKALYWKTHYGRMTVRAFGGLRETGIESDVEPLLQVQTMAKLGCDGVKMMQMHPLHRRERGFGVDDPFYDPMFSFMEENNLPVCMHVAEPEDRWFNKAMSEEAIARGWYYGPESGCVSKEQLTEETLAMAKKHPKLKISLAHFFFLSDFPDEAERVMRNYPNIYFDLTPGTEMFPNFSKRIDFWHDFFVKYNDRILFGTDSNNFKTCNGDLNRFVKIFLTHDQTEYTEKHYLPVTVRGLGLTDAQAQTILWENYERFVGTAPRYTDEKACKREAERLLDLLPGEGKNTETDKWMRENLTTDEDYEPARAWLKNYLQE